MNLERLIEEKAVAHFASVLGDLAKVRGVWQIAKSGEVKNEEDEVIPLVDFSVSPASYPVPTAKATELLIRVSVTVPQSLDVNGERTDAIWSKNSNELHLFQLSLTDVRRVFSIPEHFRLYGFTLNGGEGPDIIEGCTGIETSFTVRGQIFSIH
jgi:hypothetical protein